MEKQRRLVVLVVEDEPLLLIDAVDLVTEAGFEAIGVKSADEAIRILESRDDIRIVFTDVNMPGAMNGRQLVDEALKRRPGLKTLYTSGYTENAIVHHGRLDSGVLLLAKPYRKTELARMIRLALAS